MKLGAHKEQILDDDDDNEHWHLVLDTFVDETNCFHSFQTNVKSPSKTHKSRDLEDLRAESLG